MIAANEIAGQAIGADTLEAHETRRKDSGVRGDGARGAPGSDTAPGDAGAGGMEGGA